MRSRVPGTITVRLFARYAEIVGREVVTLSLPEPATVADVVHRVRAELPGATDLPERPLAAPHREAAFAACRYVIEAVKQRLPIWKKELRADGSTLWVDPQGRPAVVGPE